MIPNDFSHPWEIPVAVVISVVFAIATLALTVALALVVAFLSVIPSGNLLSNLVTAFSGDQQHRSLAHPRG